MCTTLPVIASNIDSDIVLTDDVFASEISVENIVIPSIPYNQEDMMSVPEKTLPSKSSKVMDLNDVSSQYSIIIPDVEKNCSFESYSVISDDVNYKNTNEKIPEFSSLQENISENLNDEQQPSINNLETSSVSSRNSSSSAVDAAYRLSSINSRDAFALQNQTGRTGFIGDNIGEEYIDPLTGNLVVTETDLVLPGIDGFDFTLSRYYSLAQAEVYTKSVDIVSYPKQMILEEGTYVVVEQINNIQTGQTSTYYYPYNEWSDALLRMEEIESRDTCNGLYMYDASCYTSSEGETITLDYYYKSELNSTSYQQMRNSLGAGWSWSFPSVQVVKDSYSSLNYPLAAYFHDGKGNVMEVEYDELNGCRFKNYVGGDISFEYVFDFLSICGTSRIDYYVEDSNGTEYYFGMYGELRTIMDVYGNKIQFQYDYVDYYGAEEEMPRLDEITDSVGRIIDFEYTTYLDCEIITVTVKENTSAENELVLTYEKQLIDVTSETKDENGNILDSEYISTEHFLKSFTNAEGETTNYIPALYEGERKYMQPIMFSLSDKAFTEVGVNNITSGYANNLVYLLGSIVRPHSHSYYSYDMCVRNLGDSGVSQMFRVAESGEYLHVVEPVTDEEAEIIFGHDKDTTYYTYYGDYTGYPHYSSFENIPHSDNDVATTVEEKRNSKFIREYYKEDDAVLEKIVTASYENPVGNDLYVKYEVEDYLYKQPVMIKVTYSNNKDFEGYTYESYLYREISTYTDKNFGKPLIVTEELDYNTAISTDREKHAMLYTYDDNTGFMLSKAWYKSKYEKCTETYTYGSEHRISKIQHVDGTETLYSYQKDDSGNVTKITASTENDLGTTVVEEIYSADTGYSLPSVVTKTVTENENTSVQATTYTYDMLLGVVKTATDNDGNVTYYEYDKLGRPVRIVYPEYSVYSSYGVKSRRILPVEEIDYSTVARDYGDISGDYKLSVQEKSTTLIYYDVTGLTVDYPTSSELTDVPYTHYEAKIEYFLGTGEIIESNILDQLSSDSNAPDAVLTTTYYYDSYNNTVKVVDPQGNITIAQYDDLGRQVKVTDAFDNTYIMEYNISSDEIGFKSQSYFVPADNLTAKENIVDYKYDRLQRVTSEKGYSSYPDVFSEIKYTYDYVGNVIGITDANGNLNSDGYTQSNTYDMLNRITASKNANNEIIRNIYDNAGNIKKQTITDSNGVESVLYQRDYDGEGKLVKDTDNAGNSNTYQYNDLGQLVQSRDRTDKVFNLSYNELGVQDTISKVIDEGTITSRHYSYLNPYGANDVYDARGSYDEDSGNYLLQTNEVDSYTYSPTGKLLKQISSYTQNTFVDGVYFEPYMSYDYDSNGNVLSAYTGLYDETNSIIWGATTYYEYDKNRLSKVQIDGANTRNTAASVNVTYEYYDDGKLKSVTYPPLTDGSILKSEYVYDGLSRLTSLTNYKGTDVLSSYAYTYDSNGNILTTTETVGTTQHSTTYTYDKLNRITSVAGTKCADSYYEYDARGNRKANFEQIDFLSEDDAMFRYNEEDNLYYSEVGEESSIILYSANGYRYLKQENNEYPEFYVYDSNGRLNMIAEPTNLIGSDNSVITVMYPEIQYIWGPDRVLAKIDNTMNKSYYYLYNGHGDVVQIVDTSGTVKNTYDYDVWGNFLKKEETIENHFTYFGQTYDETTGLYYLRARYYDPTTGRFTQQDPAEDGYNWYVYCGNKPITYVDPLGLAIWLIHGTNLNNDPSPQDTWQSDFREYISEQFDGESVFEGNWKGGNSVGSRKEGAEKIYKEIKEYIDENPDEPIRLIGHSHGGNVAIMVTNLLAEDGYYVNNLVTIATPVRGYKLDKDVTVGQHLNIYNTKDKVQIVGGSVWLLGAAKRKFKNATNVNVTKEISKEKEGPIKSHSAMHSNIEIWESSIWPKINK